jgi:hypothetical protein
LTSAKIRNVWRPGQPLDQQILDALPEWIEFLQAALRRKAVLPRAA